MNNDNDNIEAVEYNRVTRTVYKRRRLDTYNLTKKNNTEEYDDVYSDEDLEIYKDIDIESILAPISNPTDLITRPSIASTYKNNVLKRLANHSIETIEHEQFFVMKLSSLLDTLLGEGGNQILESDLQLPVYKSILNDSISHSSSLSLDSTQTALAPSSQDANMTSISSETEPEETKRTTRRHSTQETQDPFFALPQFLSSSQTLNIDPDLAQRARQLTTIGLQRNEEYIRNLTNLRNAIVRAERLKEKLRDYAREMNGDPDAADLYMLANPTVVKEKSTGKADRDKAESGNETGGEGTEENNKGRVRGGRRRAAGKD